MLKTIKIASLFSIALIPNLGSTPNESPVYIDYCSLSGNNKYLYIRTAYTVTEDLECGCDFYYTFECDGVSKSIGSCHVSKLSKVTSELVPTFSEQVPSADFGVQNNFTVTMVPEDPTLSSESITLHYNVTGSKCVYYKEKDNKEGLSSGFIMESYNHDPSKGNKAEDRVKFINFEDDYVLDSYNYFDISTLKFQYYTYKLMDIKGNFYFDFIDSYTLFDGLPIEEGTMYRRLPLTVIKNGDISSFVVKNKLYYDELTHKMSSTYVEGYKETSLLYFPKDSFDKLKTITARLVLDINGYTDFTMIAEFKILNIKKLFGDCEDSEYCIHSSEDHSENKREKEIEVEI